MTYEQAWYELHLKLGHTQRTCAYCGRRLVRSRLQGLTAWGHGHHVLVVESRAKGEQQKIALLSSLNIVLACPVCHVPPKRDFVYRCSLYLLEKYGPVALEDWVEGLPLENRWLPRYYWEAKETWLESTTPR